MPLSVGLEDSAHPTSHAPAFLSSVHRPSVIMTTPSRRTPLRLDRLEDRAVPAAGALDTTFSGDGLATHGLFDHNLANEAASALAVQADGKLVVAGTVFQSEILSFLAVYRYNPDGSLDPTFGTDGKVLFDAGSDERAFAVAVQADGKIVVAGDVSVPNEARSFLAVRLNADGTPDATFNGDGNADGIIVTHVVGSGVNASPSGAQGVAIQADGKIVLAGSTGRPLEPEAFAVVRYLSNGAIDTGFGTNGRAVFDFGPGGLSSATSVGIDAAGRIVVGGVSFGLGFQADFAVARLNPADGLLDNTFGGGDGRATFNFSFDEAVFALAFDGNAILAAGYTSPGFGADFAVVRFTDIGAPDLNFSGDGLATVDFTSGPVPFTDDRATAVAVAGGQVILAGQTADQFFTVVDFAAARLNVATGAIDTTFSGDGRQTIDFGGTEDGAQGVAVTGGKVVLAGTSSNNNGDFALARLNGNGTLDTAFGIGGRLTTNFGLIDEARNDFGQALLALPDGKVIVAGSSSGDFALARFNRDGTIDTTFGDGGSVIVDFLGSDELLALVPYPGGKLLAVGRASTEFALARFDANGNLDSTFGGDGRVTTPFPNGDAGARAVTVLPNGRIVVAGTASGQVAVARYLPNGQLDTTLDFDGRLVDTGNFDMPNSVAVGANGSILVTAQGGITRYLSNGLLDASFGGDGRWDRPAVLTGVTLNGSAVQADGKIVVAGTVLNTAPPAPSDTDFVLFRVNVDGSLDAGFGTAGVTRTDFAGANDSPTAIRLQADGKIVVAGNSGTDLFALARYTAGGVLDGTFGTGGLVTGTIGAGTQINALFLQANGKLDIAGTVGTFFPDFAVAQFRGDNTVPVSAGIADFTVDEDAADDTFDLRAVFDDAQDTDLELEFTIQSNTNPGLLTATLDASDVLRLDYLDNRYGTATITVRATDLDGGFTDEEFTVTVNSVNDLPVANNDSAATNDQTAITVDVLANDPDNDFGNPPPDTEVLTIISATGAQRGTVEIVNNQIRYTPKINTAGVETITYTIQDRAGATDTATLNITVTDITRPVVEQIRMQYGNRRFEVLGEPFRVFGWSNVRKFEVRFSENVSVQQSDLVLTGLNNPGGYAFSGFTYNATTFTAT